MENSPNSSQEAENIDFESAIPETHVKKPSTSSVVYVKTIARRSRGFVSTKLEKIAIEERKTTFVRPVHVIYKKAPRICDTISLAIEDLLNSEKFSDHWKVFNTHFRCVLIYGRIIVLNQFTGNERNYYKFKIDDGTGSIIGIMGISKEAQKDAEGFKKHLQTKLLYKSIPNIPQNLLESVKMVTRATFREASKLVTQFPLGPMKQKALVLGNLYMSEQEQSLQLNVIDLSPNDDAELAWKRQLNLLYEREYFKDVR